MLNTDMHNKQVVGTSGAAGSDINTPIYFIHSASFEAQKMWDNKKFVGALARAFELIAADLLRCLSLLSKIFCQSSFQHHGF